MKKWIAALALTLASIAAVAQTNQGPFNTPQMNSTYYVGSLTGGASQFYPTIQSAVTAACAAGTNNVVDIPPAYTGSDPISGVTGGCTSTTLRDEHAGLPVTCYTWQSTVYSSTGVACSGSNAATPGIQIENVFNGPGTINFTHNLNDEYPLVSCFSLSGASAISVHPVDVNNMAVTTAGAATILCAFQPTSGLAPNFSFNISPTTINYVPSLSGTQTPTYAISQSAIAGYTGVVTYSTNSLASGMSSSYSPSTITGSGSSTLTLSFPNTQAAGTTNFNASGTDGTITHANPASISISDINQNLLDGWDMREGSGTTFLDATSNANNMTFSSGYGSWGAVSGFPGVPFTFNGTGPAVGSNFNLTNFTCASSFTVTFWAKITSAAGYNRIIGDLATHGWLIQSNPGSGISFYILWNDSISDAMDWTSVNIINSLHFFAYVFNGTPASSTSTMYIDGVAQTVHNNNAHSGSASCASGSPVRIAVNPIAGTIADVAIYSGAKTATQIAAYYAAGIK